MAVAQDIWAGVATNGQDAGGWRSLKSGSVVVVGNSRAAASKSATADSPLEGAGSQEAATRFDSLGASRMHIRNPVVRPPLRRTQRTFVRTASWEGTVVERFDSYFTAEVIQEGTVESSYVEFDITDVAPTEIGMCEPGGLFYWTIGYETKDGGQRSRASVISFRRTGLTEKA